jgi:hypothetical protein
MKLETDESSERLQSNPHFLTPHPPVAARSLEKLTLNEQVF